MDDLLIERLELARASAAQRGHTDIAAQLALIKARVVARETQDAETSSKCTHQHTKDLPNRTTLCSDCGASWAPGEPDDIIKKRNDVLRWHRVQQHANQRARTAAMRAVARYSN